MVAIPFPLSSSPGARAQEGAGRLVNVYSEPRGEGLGPIWRRAPGLKAFGTTAHSGPRGFILIGSTLYQALSGKLVRFTSAGGAGTAVADLAGTADVFFAVNNKRPTPDQAVVTENGAFTFTSGSVTAWADADLPQPNAVCFVGGYFMFTIGDGRVFASGLNDVTQDSTHFATAESKPDTLRRPVPLGGQLLLCGANSMEVWGPPINATGFPFSYVHTIQRGLAGAHAIAGFEDGFGRGILFVGDDNAVHLLNGYTAEKVSPPDLDRLIEAVSDKTTLKAMVYVSGGHAFWQLSAGTAWTWTFDLNSGKWHERDSYSLTRSRMHTSVFAFGKWLCGDTQSGNCVEIDRLTKTEIGNPLRARFESGPVIKFPNRIRVARADFNFATGVGIATGSDPSETDPAIEVSFSRDGGVTYSTPWIRKLGRQAHGEARIFVTNAGLSTPYGHRWRLDITDAVDIGLMGGEQSAELRVN